MNGTIVAVNRQLGALVAETPDHRCVVLGTLGRVTAEVGDVVGVVDGDWSEVGSKVIDNVTQGTQMQMVLQAVDITRTDAIGRMTVL